MAKFNEKNQFLLLLTVGLFAWLIPGSGYFIMKQKKRAIIIFIMVVLTFCAGLYVGSIGVIDPVRSKAWYVAQIMTSPLVAIIGNVTAGGGYTVFGRPNDIGQLYTGIAGLLNLLCIVNSVYFAYLKKIDSAGA